VRERLVEVNFPMLDSAARAGVGSAVTLNLFNNDGTLFPPVTLTATPDRVERTSSGQGVIWSGKVSGDPASRVTLVAENGAMAGDILAGSRVYHVRSVGRGVHAIYELDPGAFPPDEHVLPGGVRLGSGSAGAARAAVAAAITGQAAATSPDAVSAPSGGAATPATPTDDGLSVDLMVVYTSAAAAEVGGAAGMNAQVDLVGQFA
jgi:hypothetical protein